MRSFIRHPSDIPIELVAEESALDPRLHNLSLGGLACESDRFLTKGTPVAIRMPSVFPSFRATGRVVWCRPTGSAFEVGVQFTDPEDLFMARMVEQICHIEHYKNAVRDAEGRELDGEQAAREWIAKYGARFPEFGASGT